MHISLRRLGIRGNIFEWLEDVALLVSLFSPGPEGTIEIFFRRIKAMGTCLRQNKAQSNIWRAEYGEEVSKIHLNQNRGKVGTHGRVVLKTFKLLVLPLWLSR